MGATDITQNDPDRNGVDAWSIQQWWPAMWYGYAIESIYTVLACPSAKWSAGWGRREQVGKIGGCSASAADVTLRWRWSAMPPQNSPRHGSLHRSRSARHGIGSDCGWNNCLSVNRGRRQGCLCSLRPELSLPYSLCGFPGTTFRIVGRFSPALCTASNCHWLAILNRISRSQRSWVSAANRLASSARSRHSSAVITHPTVSA
jgi:hypothetical protein